MKKSVLSILFVVLALCICFNHPVSYAEEEIAVVDHPGWLMILEQLDTYDWLSEDEKEEYHKYYNYHIEHGETDEHLLQLIKAYVGLYQSIQKRFVFEEPEGAEPSPGVSLTLSEKLEQLGVVLLEETIQPCYEASFFDLATVGHLVLEQTTGHFSYTAKTETEDHRFGGNVIFYYDAEGIPRFEVLNYSSATDPAPNQGPAVPGSAGRTHKSSFWYEDHKEEISSELEKFGEAPIPRENVKLVNVKQFSNAMFYLQGEHGEYLIPVGNEESLSGVNVYPIDDELRALADERYRKLLEEHANIDQWEKEHPGEMWIGGGSSNDGPEDPDQTVPAPEDPAETGDPEPGEADAPAAAELPAALAVTVAVFAAVAVILTGVLRLFGR